MWYKLFLLTLLLAQAYCNSFHAYNTNNISKVFYKPHNAHAKKVEVNIKNTEEEVTAWEIWVLWDMLFSLMVRLQLNCISLNVIALYIIVLDHCHK